MKDPRIPKKVLTHNNVRPPYDKQFMLFALAQGKETFGHLSQRLKDDEDIMLAAVRE